MLFLSARSLPVGGGVGPIKILDENQVLRSTSDVTSAIQGRDVILITHGFNVNQVSGLQALSDWAALLRVGNTVVVGLLWPGDARWIHGIDYVIEGDESTGSGNTFADFINANFSSALSISFASHSMGARVVLQAIGRLNRSVRRLLLMAGAIDNTCLTGEYASSATKVLAISVLASRSDDVLKWAFPAGNFIGGLFSRGSPYVHQALGREGPAAPYPDPNNIRADWQIPDNWGYGHGSYLPKQAINATFPQPVLLPAGNPPSPANVPDPSPDIWQPSFSAGIASTRFP